MGAVPQIARDISCSKHATTASRTEQIPQTRQDPTNQL